jgi:hypothetical protein
MLSQHLDLIYNQLHNLAALPTLVIILPRSRIIRRDGFYNTIGNSDYLFVEGVPNPTACRRSQGQLSFAQTPTEDHQQKVQGYSNVVATNSLEGTIIVSNGFE